MASVLVIPVALFGGTFLLANKRVDSTLNYVAQAVNLVDISYVGNTPELPPDYTYHIKVIVQNGTSDPANVGITHALITIQEITFDIIGSAGWKAWVEAKGMVIFEGDIIVKRAQLKELADKTVTVQVSGYVTVKSRYGFVEKTVTSLIERPAEAEFPGPITPPVESEVPPATSNNQQPVIPPT